jgi:hypothetical protein
MDTVKRTAVVAALGWMLAVGLPGAALAGGGGHGHGHGHGGGSKYSFSFGFGPWWGGPWWYGPQYYYPYAYGYAYPYPYAVYPAPVYAPAPVAQEPPVYIERDAAPAASGWWYYCESAGAYYPDVASCDEPWVKVPPRAE